MSLVGFVSCFDISQSGVSIDTFMPEEQKHRMEAPKSSVPWGLRAHEDSGYG